MIRFLGNEVLTALVARKEKRSMLLSALCFIVYLGDWRQVMQNLTLDTMGFFPRYQENQGDLHAMDQRSHRGAVMI